MKTAIVTGAGGLVGSETVRHLPVRVSRGGVDTICGSILGRRSTQWAVQELQRAFPESFQAVDADIRDFEAVRKVFEDAGSVICGAYGGASFARWAREPFWFRRMPMAR